MLLCGFPRLHQTSPDIATNFAWGQAHASGAPWNLPENGQEHPNSYSFFLPRIYFRELPKPTFPDLLELSGVLEVLQDGHLQWIPSLCSSTSACWALNRITLYFCRQFQLGTRKGTEKFSTSNIIWSPRSLILPAGYPGRKIHDPWVPWMVHKHLTSSHRQEECQLSTVVTSVRHFRLPLPRAFCTTAFSAKVFPLGIAA